MFARQLCGVDGSPASEAAVAQAARLAAPGTSVLLATAVDPWNAPTGLADGPAPTEDVVREHAEALLAAAAARWTDALVRTALLDGWAPRALLDRAAEERSDVILVGMHGQRRSTAYMLGSVATTVLHEARCSVFVARERDLERFPRTVVLGVDGSPHSARAAEVAHDLAARLGAEVRAVTATGRGSRLLPGGPPEADVDAARRAAPGVHVDERRPVDALVAAVREVDADLLIVGARGLRGVRAMGSVSERIAHEAPCSVVVVRPEVELAPDEPAPAGG
jgi:nucleotide-binding universal stress UspA family protein